ncbi:hypothetical protein QN345_00565 [Cryobacterium sp. 10I1]|uniref:hypothetical protein n=1 Tax=Cryobacterium sp. 10I1 TaxID=3048578 RepID=UPI002B22B1D4|nr:hypothetical protein [Cryobacterium sp. 10I1]MEB0303832.1 hypothetical protein [Cryobacterium sp. 10I1]
MSNTTTTAVLDRKRAILARGTDAVLIDSMLAADKLPNGIETILVSSWLATELERRYPTVVDYLDAWVEPDVMDGRTYAEALRDGLAELGVVA